MSQNLPHHIAIVMDGNGRWAHHRGLLRVEGHKAGIEPVKMVIESCLEKNIPYLSLFAFSSENWARPQNEVDFLMKLFISVLNDEVTKLHEHGVCVRFTGERSRLIQELQEEMSVAENLTKRNSKLILQIAVNYSGKWDIVQAVKKCIERYQAGLLKPEDLNEQSIENLLMNSDIPCPDLLIRTSGELRISNFFLWQLAYTELYFTNIHWPDFTSAEFEKALLSYAGRERRFGKIENYIETEKC